MDFAFIVGYGTALWMGVVAASWVFWTPRAAAVARFGTLSVVLTRDLRDAAPGLRGPVGSHRCRDASTFLRVARKEPGTSRNGCSVSPMHTPAFPCCGRIGGSHGQLYRKS